LGKEILQKGNSWTRDIVVFARILLWLCEAKKFGKYVLKYCGIEAYNLRKEARILLDETMTRKEHQQKNFEVNNLTLVPRCSATTI
jgi:hypothetical protein